MRNSEMEQADSNEVVLSIGSLCQTAWQIQNAGLRKFSGPFDWIFSSPYLVADCLEDDFRTYLDRSSYVRGDSDTQWSPRKYVERFGQRVMFNHHNMMIDDDYNKIRRAVDRFRDVLGSTQSKTFVLMTPSGLLDHLGFNPALATFGKFTTNYRMLVVGVRDSDSAGEPQLSLRSKSELTEEWLFRPRSSMSNGMQYDNPDDNDDLKNLLIGSFSR
jgi:hypothetical protein